MKSTKCVYLYNWRTVNKLSHMSYGFNTVFVLGYHGITPPSLGNYFNRNDIKQCRIIIYNSTVEKSFLASTINVELFSIIQYFKFELH